MADRAVPPPTSSSTLLRERVMPVTATVLGVGLGVGLGVDLGVGAGVATGRTVGRTVGFTVGRTVAAGGWVAVRVGEGVASGIPPTTATWETAVQSPTGLPSASRVAKFGSPLSGDRSATALPLIFR